MTRPNVWLYGGLIVVATLLVLVWVRSKQTRALDPSQMGSLSLTGKIYICAVVCSADQFKKWLGNDYGRLIVFGDGSKGAFEILAMPE